jgi:alkylated DNA repair dioxygenase AlkB
MLDSKQQNIDLPGADIKYVPNWLEKPIADKLLAHLLHKIAWQEATIKIFGKEHKIPRLQAWYGEEGAGYTYSGLKMTPLPWEKNLKVLKSRCEAQCNTRFNSVLANLYRDGNDSMGFHADDEPELGEQPIIASVSLGEQRNFDLINKSTKQKQRIVLEHGSLLIMQGETQKHWQHGINKSKRPHDPRINLTFRFVHQMQ